jgi:hypothetical protein
LILQKLTNGAQFLGKQGRCRALFCCFIRDFTEAGYKMFPKRDLKLVLGKLKSVGENKFRFWAAGGRHS